MDNSDHENTDGSHKLEGSQTLQRHCISSEFAYHLLLSLAFALLAVSTQRFKVLWVPHMCLVAASTLTDFDGWSWFFNRCGALGSHFAVSWCKDNLAKIQTVKNDKLILIYSTRSFISLEYVCSLQLLL